MIDLLGNELSVGDVVVAVAHQRTSSTLYIGRVVKLTEKLVVVNTYKKEPDWRVKSSMRVSPYKVAKVDFNLRENLDV